MFSILAYIADIFHSMWDQTPQSTPLTSFDSSKVPSNSLSGMDVTTQNTKTSISNPQSVGSSFSPADVELYFKDLEKQALADETPSLFIKRPLSNVAVQIKPLQLPKIPYIDLTAGPLKAAQKYALVPIEEAGAREARGRALEAKLSKLGSKLGGAHLSTFKNSKAFEDASTLLKSSKATVSLSEEELASFKA